MGKSKKDLFLELARPDEMGFCKKIGVDQFVGAYECLRLGNGGSWCRDDGPLAKIYNVERIKEGRAIVAISLHGFKKVPIEKPIPSRIRKQIIGKKCVVLATSKVEVDHKDGRRDNPRLSNPDKVREDDFQPLSKAANNAKRQHCKECRKTGNRFDAKRLGYRVGQVRGHGVYRGSCGGCYWHNPFFFNQEVSREKEGGLQEQEEK